MENEEEYSSQSTSPSDYRVTELEDIPEEGNEESPDYKNEIELEVQSDSRSGQSSSGTKGRSAAAKMRAQLRKGLGSAINPLNVGIKKMKKFGDDLVDFANNDEWEDFQDETKEEEESVGTERYLQSDYQVGADGISGTWKIDENADMNRGAEDETGIRRRKSQKSMRSPAKGKPDLTSIDVEPEVSDGLGAEEGGISDDSHGRREQVQQFMLKRKQKFMQQLAMWDNYSALYLILIGFFTAAVGASMDWCISFLQKHHHDFMLLAGKNEYGQFFMWFLYYVICFWVAITLTVRIAPQAAGSGVPELKSIMSGIHLKRVLSFRVLLIKIFGLICSLGSGAFLGKEGPFIHLSATLATQLAKIPLFERIRHNEHLMQIMLGAACATGVASHFGSPIGGVLFSIEITTAYYPTRNYWTAYIGAVTGGACFRYLWNTMFSHEPGFKPLVPTYYDSNAYFGLIEMLIFIVLGVTTGILGIGFIKMYSFIARTWKKIVLKYDYIRSPYAYSLLVAILTAVLTFPPLLGSFMSLSPLKGLGDLVSHWELGQWEEGKLGAHDWTSGRTGNKYANLVLFMASRYFITPMSIIMPVPCGLFVPILTIGGSVGRIFGEAAYDFLDKSWLYETSTMYAGSYAIAGAAGFTASVTQTLSAAVIVFEITGSIMHLIPTLVTVMVAVGVNKRFKVGSIYDCISVLKGLPFLPDLKKETYNLRAKDLMMKETHYITKEFLVEPIKKTLAASNLTMFPVVNNDEQMLLIGTINRDQLEKALIELDKKPDISPELAKIMAAELGEEAMIAQISEHKKRLDHMIIHSTPIRFLEATPITQIHLLFITLRLTNAFVTANGKLKGAITRQALREAIIKEDGLIFT